MTRARPPAPPLYKVKRDSFARRRHARAGARDPPVLVVPAVLPSIAGVSATPEWLLAVGIAAAVSGAVVGSVAGACSRLLELVSGVALVLAVVMVV